MALIRWTAIISTVTSTIILGSFFISLPVLYDLNIFTDVGKQPDQPGTYTIVETVLAACALITSAISTWTILGDGKFIDPPRQKLTAGFFIAFAVAELIILVARLYWRGVLTDMKLLGDVGCRDTSLEGNPVERYEIFGNKKIETTADCVFNSFNTNNIDGGDLLDWSKSINYDAKTRSILLQAIISSGQTGIGIDQVPYYHSYWYWGCNSVCHDRSTLNVAWMYLSLFAFLAYLTIGLLFLCSVGGVNSDQTPTISDEDSPLIPDESAPLIPDEDITSDEDAPDKSDDDDSSESNPFSSSTPPEYSLKMRLRL